MREMGRADFSIWWSGRFPVIWVVTLVAWIEYYDWRLNDARLRRSISLALYGRIQLNRDCPNSKIESFSRSCLKIKKDQYRRYLPKWRLPSLEFLNTITLFRDAKQICSAIRACSKRHYFGFPITFGSCRHLWCRSRCHVPHVGRISSCLEPHEFWSPEKFGEIEKYCKSMPETSFWLRLTSLLIFVFGVNFYCFAPGLIWYLHVELREFCEFRQILILIFVNLEPVENGPQSRSLMKAPNLSVVAPATTMPMTVYVFSTSSAIIIFCSRRQLY